MSNLLINEPPLQVLPSLAKAIGLNEAIMLQQVHYWLHHAKVKHDGRMWIYKTLDQWHEQDFSFWSLDTIKRTISNLRKMKLLLVEKLSSNSFNRVNHYTIDYEALGRLELNNPQSRIAIDKGNMHQSTSAESTQHQGNMHQSDKSNMHQCLRDNKENTKESNSNNNKTNFSITSIQDWVQPNLTEINEMLKLGQSVTTNITQSQYDYQLSKFKNFHIEQELSGSIIKTEARRKDLLAEWIERDCQHQKKNKPKSSATSVNTNKTDWSSVGTNPDYSDSDIPDVFHPSHSKPTKQAKQDPNTSVVVNGLWKEPLPGMSVQQTYDYIAQCQMPGEMQDEAYDRLLNQMQEVV